jgi:ParB family chromosome partitioning protein
MVVKNKRGLGRGIDALFEDNKETYVNTKKNKNLLTFVPIEFIKPNPLQPRKDFSKEALTELSNSIKDRGVLQPIIVRPVKNKKDEWQIIAGERRWRAAQLAGLHEMPVSIKDIEDEDAAIIALIENIQRENLSPIEEAVGYKKLMDKLSITQEEIGIKMRRSRAYVTNLIRLLTLPKEVQKLLEEKLISIGQVRPIIGHKNCTSLARMIVNKQLSSRQVELLVKTKDVVKKGFKNKVDVNIRSLENEIEEIIGLKTIIKDKNGKGQIIFNYKNLEQLDAIIKKIKK